MSYTVCKKVPKDWQGQNYLRCTHSYNRKSSTSYLMYCDVLKIMPDGRLKIRVYGERWRHTEGSRIRYVSPFRVSPVSQFI